MRIAVVDGYSTGAALAQRLHAAGIECLHVQSRPAGDFTPYLLRSYRPGDYTRDLGYAPDTGALVAWLNNARVSRVIAGTESGVMLAESVSMALGLPTNSPAQPAARRDKALMAKVVRAAGLATPYATTARSAAEAAEWFAASGLPDAVVKPRASGGSDHVRFCSTPEEVAKAAARVLGDRNIFGEPNTTVLVQQRLEGTEYYINTVSARGVHRVAEIWRYTKRRGPASTPIYDYEEPVSVSSTVGQILRSFTVSVLNALGITETPAHTEVMLTADGPVLIETGARLGGATAPGIVEKYCGTSQTSLAAAALIDPASLTGFNDTHDRHVGALRNVEFINPFRGPASADALTKVASLPTVVHVAYATDPGTLLEPTSDLLNSPGYTYLAAHHHQDIEQDYTTLRAWESEGLHTM
ncbi:ATP-grasp domain-containing protein [Streptomyces sp. CA-106110]|uniref:ATP-grasp domain-containing protein n=1 Tax=Streptomyces sp. CA-106110 TaxID=3240044 RepID=UPI003D921084